MLGFLDKKSFYITADKGSNQTINNFLFEKREEFTECERF